jgi:hypothetical protein
MFPRIRLLLWSTAAWPLTARAAANDALDGFLSSRSPASPPAWSRTAFAVPLRIMHRINAAAIFSMIGSGWRIYNDDVPFGWLHFPEFLVIGKWAQYGLQWHFFGIWIFVLDPKQK